MPACVNICGLEKAALMLHFARTVIIQAHSRKH